MKKTPISSTDSVNLRRKAEEKLKHKTTEISSEPSESDSLKLLQELRVQRAELEIQNEELKAVMQSEAETAKFVQELEVLHVELKSQNEELLSAVALTKDATDLYDFAPTGYYTLSREGEILRLNLSGAVLLGKDRSKLAKSRFGFFVCDETKLLFNHFLDDVFNRKTRQTCDITLTANGGTPKYVQLAGIVTENNENCLVTASNITEYKLAEDALGRQNESLSKITQFSVDLSMLPATENHEVFIAKKIKEITGAVAVVYSEYVPESGMLVPEHIELEPVLLKKIAGLLGGTIHNVHSPVDEETYREITSSIIGRFENITDMTFGAVPRPIATIISSLLKVDRYYGIAYLIEGKLFGTSMLAMGKHTPDPPEEVLRNIAFLVAVSLRRKRAEDAMTQSEVRYRTLYENSLSGILITQPDGSILAANPEACRLFDRTESEICHGGRNGIIDLTNPLLPLALAERARTGKYRGELTFKHSDGTTFPVDMVSSINVDATGLQHSNIFFQDITKRKLAEEALHYEQWRLRSIIEGTNVGTWEWNVQTGENVYNEQWAKIIGYSLDELQPSNISVWEKYTHPDDLKRSKELLRKHFSGELPYYNCECRMKHKKGHWIWVHDSGQVISWTDEGKPLMMFGTHTDITERKETEKALLESQANLSAIFDATDETVILISVDETVLSLNQTAASHLGHSVGKITNKKLRELISPEVLAYRRSFMKHVWEKGKPVVFEDMNKGRWFMNHMYPILDETGKVGRMAIFARDITEQKLTQDALNESESRFRRLYESASLGIFQTTPDGKVISVNPSLARMLGYSSPEELKNTVKNSSLDIFADPTRKNEIISILDKNPEMKSFENVYKRKDGTTFVGWLNVARINDQEGRFHHLEGFIEDITQRKQVEKALLKSKEQYDKLAANIPVGVYVLHSKTDGSFNLDYASPRMAEMLGVSVNALLSDARLVYESIYPDDRAGFAKLNEDRIRLKQTFDWTGRVLYGGQIKWMHLTSSPEILENGDILWHGLIVDITKEKLAEDELKEAHNRLLKIASRVPGVVFQYKLRPDGTDCFPYASEGLYEIYHISPEEVREDASKAFANIHPADFAGLTASIQLSATDLSPWKYEYRVKFPDGTVNWLLGNAVPEKEADGSVLWHGFITDITERKLAEMALKESESRFKNLFEHHSAIMLLIDPDSGLIIDANKAATHFYGYSKSLLQTMTIDEINILSKEQVKMELEKARNSNHNNFVFLHKLATGEERTVEVYSSPISFQEKLILFSIIQDITKRKLAENEIQIKNEELLKVNAEKDKFFSIIAHDLRGPIGGFMGLTALMAEGMANMTLDDLQNIARVMKRSASNLYNLLGNLLEWSLMQRGLTTFEPVSFLLIHKIHENIIQAQESATKKAITINTFIPDNLKVCADENMLACIIRNLVANAVKFTPKGGNISISATAVNNRFAEISVTDSGIGMSKKLIENLFTIDVNTSRKGTDGELSSGLGLMICKDFIEKHGGELKVESEVGKGSTFRFTIPSADFE